MNPTRKRTLPMNDKQKNNKKVYGEPF